MRVTDPLAGLSVFLSLVEAGSFTAAAERLCLSRATVSTQLQELEHRLGVRLVHRTTRQVALTEAGSAYARALNGLLERVRAAEGAVQALQTEPEGRLRVTLPYELGYRHVLPVLPAFARAHPKLTLDVQFSNAFVNLIEENFDLGIRVSPWVEPNLIARRIGAFRLVLCAAPAYIEAHGAPKSPADLADHACLHQNRLRWGDVWVLKRGEETCRVPMTAAFETNDGEALRAAAIAGMGVTVLPTFIVGDDLRAGALVEVLHEWRPPPAEFLAVYPDNRRIAAKVRSFVHYLADHFAKLPDLVAG